MCPVISEENVMAGLKWEPEMRKKAQEVTVRPIPKAKAFPKLTLVAFYRNNGHEYVTLDTDDENLRDRAVWGHI